MEDETHGAGLSSMLHDESVANIASNTYYFVLDPAMGEGKFVVDLIRLRLGKTHDALEAMGKVYGVDLQPDKVELVKNTVRDLCLRHEESLDRDLLETKLASNFVCGNFLTNHASLLPCPTECEDHASFTLPLHFDLILGKPPTGEDSTYQAFVSKSLTLAGLTYFVLPTAWKINNVHGQWRRATLPHLKSLDDLPWTDGPRTCLALYDRSSTAETFELNGRQSKGLDAPWARVGNSILAKAYEAWPNKLSTYQATEEQVGTFPLYVGWQGVFKPGSRKINTLQTLHHRNNHRTLPPNLFLFCFPTERERKSYLSYSTTKLAAYLQSLTESSILNRNLPLPPLDRSARFSYGDDEFLYRQLKLTNKEIAEIEKHTLFITAKALAYYEEVGVAVGSSALLGKARRACSSCGSSSFHRPYCSRSLAGRVPDQLFTEEQLEATRTKNDKMRNADTVS